MKKKATNFNGWLSRQLGNPEFKKAFEKEDIRARLALRIAQMRQKRHMTQGQLAKKLHTTQQVVSDLETFKHANITLLTLQKIATALDSRLVVDFR